MFFQIQIHAIVKFEPSFTIVKKLVKLEHPPRTLAVLCNHLMFTNTIQ